MTPSLLVYITQILYRIIGWMISMGKEDLDLDEMTCCSDAFPPERNCIDSGKSKSDLAHIEETNGILIVS